MLIYNVTTKVQDDVHEGWLKWLREEHIPEILETGCFTGAGILRLLEVDDNEGPTYAIQYKAETVQDYNRYIEEFAPRMRSKAFDKWGDKFIAFRSLMQVVD